MFLEVFEGYTGPNKLFLRVPVTHLLLEWALGRSGGQ